MSDPVPDVLFSFGGTDGGPRVEVTVSEDAMTAWGTFYAGTASDGKLLVWPDFEDAIRATHLDSCLLALEVQDLFFQYNTSHPAPQRVVIARGRPPVAERPAFLKLEPQFYDHHFTDRGGVQVDFKEYSPFVIVKKGELLAKGILPRAGTPGLTVYGVEIPPGKKDIKHLKPGSHTLFAHGKVFSRISGRFTLEGDVFDVSDTLELDGGVGYGTGNLSFPGSVIVKGVVSDGFRLAAGGSITVKGPLDASEVLCHGDLTVEGGIIGRKPGLVRTGGKVRALYLEHCQLEALGAVAISKSILHGKVFVNADLTLDEGGRVVASSLWVKGRLTCAQLGGESGPVHITAGADFVIQRKMDAIRTKYNVLEEDILKEKTRGDEPGPGKLAALQDLVRELNVLTPQLFANPQTEVRVSGRIFEGTVIEMGYASLTVSKPLKAQVFRLAPDGKSITASPLTKGGGDSAPLA